MKLNNIFNKTSQQFKKQTFIDKPQLEAEVLISSVLDKPKDLIITNPDYKLSQKQLKKLNKVVDRRLKGEPIAYILGKKEFYGLEFIVNKNVLIPRPETELLVELALNQINGSQIGREPSDLTNKKRLNAIRVIDVGTGCGCIAISLAKNIKGNRNVEPHGLTPVAPLHALRRAKPSEAYPPSLKLRRIPSFIPAFTGGAFSARLHSRRRVKITASDISNKALKVAQKNKKKHQVNIKLIKSNLLADIKGKPDLIIANLPYLDKKTAISTSRLLYHPKISLDGGKYGLELIKKLIRQSKDKLNKNGSLLLEISPTQVDKVKDFLAKILPKAKISFKKDLTGKNRVLIVDKK